MCLGVGEKEKGRHTTQGRLMIGGDKEKREEPTKKGTGSALIH
jgi:hypothetical protein